MKLPGNNLRSYKYLLVIFIFGMIVFPDLAISKIDNTKEPILLIADEIHFDEKLGIIAAKGNVEIAYKKRTLTANQITYNQRDDIVTAIGNIVLVEPTGEVLFSEYAELTGDIREGFLRGFGMLLDDDSKLAAVTAQRKGGIETQLNQAIYSACRNCFRFDGEPLWDIKASEVIHNQERREVIYRNATLQLFGIPVAYTPFLSHPDPKVKRKSGLLTPTFGGAASLGSAFRVPYFWAISRDKDFTFDPIIYASNNPLLTGEYRQSFADGMLRTRISGIYDTLDNKNDRGRGHIDASLRFVIDKNWRFGSNIKLSSDDTYLSRFGFPGKNTLTSNLYIQRFGQRSFTSIESIYFQGLRDTDEQKRIPLVLPKIDFKYASKPQNNGALTTIDANFQSLGRDKGLSSQRLSLHTSWMAPYTSKLGTVTTLGATLQTDLYNISDSKIGKQNSAKGLYGRLFPQVMAELKYPWIKKENYGTFLVEPIAKLLVAPNTGNSDQIPNEDSLAAEFDETNIFSNNRYPGKDRIESGSRLAYGIKGGFYGNNGTNSTFIVGQSYNFNKNKQSITGLEKDRNKSDIVCRLTISPNKYFDLLYKTRLNMENLKPKRNEISVIGGIPEIQASINYILFEETEEFPKREEIYAGLTSKISKRWTAHINTRRDLGADEGMRSWGASLTYNCDCLDFSIDYKRTYTKDRDVPPEESMYIRFIFKSLGEFGTPL